VSRDAVLAGLSALSGVFAIPALVFSGGSLVASAVLSIVAIGSALVGLRTHSLRLRVLSIAGLILGIASLWYTITGWAVSLDIAQAIADLF